MVRDSRGKRSEEKKKKILWLFHITGCLLRSRTQKYLLTWFTWCCFCCLQRHFLRSVVATSPCRLDTSVARKFPGRIERFCGTIGMQTLVWNVFTTPFGTQLLYLALLPGHRAKAGFCIGAFVGGWRVARPKRSWDNLLANFCRVLNLYMSGNV